MRQVTCPFREGTSHEAVCCSVAILDRTCTDSQRSVANENGAFCLLEESQTYRVPPARIAHEEASQRPRKAQDICEYGQAVIVQVLFSYSAMFSVLAAHGQLIVLAFLMCRF